jgi:hypothetical protein
VSAIALIAMASAVASVVLKAVMGISLEFDYRLAADIGSRRHQLADLSRREQDRVDVTLGTGC